MQRPRQILLKSDYLNPVTILIEAFEELNILLLCWPAPSCSSEVSFRNVALVCSFDTGYAQLAN